jgi:S-adenosylmethionine synthetase
MPVTNHSSTSFTAEHVSPGHPDKFCDGVADRILDAVLRAAHTSGAAADAPNRQRTAIEILAKDHLVVVSGEVRMGPGVAPAVDVDAIVRQAWREVGYDNPDHISVIDHVRAQSPELQVNADADGAGDQGIMVGYATRRTPSFMPPEYEMARSLCQRIWAIGRDGIAPFARSDIKTQVTIDPDGAPSHVVIAVQHAAMIDGISDPVTVQKIVREAMIELAVRPVLGEVASAKVVVNGSGSFVVGGPIGDAGVVGRKIAVDAFGPAVPVGGGAYSGKDPTKVDRSAAYMARHIAKTAVALGVRDARDATVHLAYAIGSRQPEMITAVTERGIDISDWVRSRFTDLSPRAIGEVLGLWHPTGWSYQDTAGFGHYGRGSFPWEAVADVAA